MAKEFKTIKEQILLLNSRGIKTNQETEAQLMRGKLLCHSQWLQNTFPG